MMNKRNNLSYQSFFQGVLVGTAIGATSLAGYQYFRRILNQPRLISKAVLSNLDDFDSDEARAFFIAAENLRAGIEARHLENGQHRNILHAGYRNFRESWARDFGFATFGLLVLEEYAAVRDTLNTYFMYQSQDGRLPVKLQSMSVFSRFLHSLFGREQSIDPILTPKYISGHGAPSLDGQALLIISAAQYAQASKDFDFIQLYWDVLRRSIRWLESFSGNSDSELLYQGAYADWADSIDRHGYGLYTNVIYWYALKCMTQLAKKLDYPQDGENYERRAASLSDSINKVLWRPNLGYFASTETLDQFSSAGNLLTVVWDLADQDQAHLILKNLQKFGMAKPVPTRVAFPAYPRHLIALENRLGSLGNYHTDGAWFWIGAWHVIALTKFDRREEASELLAAIAHIIIRDQQVHEVYGLDGQPLASFWYQSEAPLTWNAGMIVYAYQVYEKHLDAGFDIKQLANQLMK